MNVKEVDYTDITEYTNFNFNFNNFDKMKIPKYASEDENSKLDKESIQILNKDKLNIVNSKYEKEINLCFNKRSKHL